MFASIALISCVSFLTWAFLACDAAITCSSGTTFDPETESCQCINSLCTMEEIESGKIFIAGLFDTTNNPEWEEHFNFAVSMINDHTDGWYDDILLDTDLETVVVNSDCNPKVAVSSYWDLKNQRGRALHGVVGCRCSGASIAVARIAGLENVPQVSMSSSSARLSDVDEFSSFFRMVAPDDSRGQVGGLVALLRSFGWDRVSVIMTDMQYTKDLATAFSNAWVGQQGSWIGDVAYSHTVSLTASGDVDKASIKQMLDGFPTDDPTINSRVIILIAHDHHAFEILEMAQQNNFQPDSIWVGTDAWSNRFPDDNSWMPSFPGYLGLVPYQYKGMENKNYLARFQAAQRSKGMDAITTLPTYAAETVDSLLSLATALSSLSPKQRREGDLVISALRNTTLAGVSGEIRFTAEGDRKNPRYTVLNFQDKAWVDVGSVGLTPDSAEINIDHICWAEAGCGVEPPLDKYDVPPIRLPSWVNVVIALCSLAIIFLGLKYWRSKEGKKKLKSSMTEMQQRINAMKDIDNELEDLDKQVEAAQRRKSSLLKKRADLQDVPNTWSTDTNETLVNVSPHDEQYWLVNDKLRETMGDAWISNVWRIQNHQLWNYYSFHKNRLAMTGVGHNEHLVFHGSSSLEPSIIYNDRQDGFMMQFSRKGFWGRGIYFAQKSDYSNSYSYKPGTDCSERPGAGSSEREMFLAKLLVGNEILMDINESASKAAECRELTVPPTDPQTGLKFNTVTGYTGGSQVWIVYENGRAYPDYLIRYYRGRRDPSRTPFMTKQEAMPDSKNHPTKTKSKAIPDLETGLGHSGSHASLPAPVPPPNAVTWEYYDAGWKPYDDAAQVKIDVGYQLYLTKKTANSGRVNIQSGSWTYEVDFTSMMQTNISHPNRTQRKIRQHVV
mmetsp:Transcript_48702/g.72299  ORF Transcript_48702/g.72299 Transcript_48702/m.72299 type:complete len:894 (-) Transcript_48702:279-2960(-)